MRIVSFYTNTVVRHISIMQCDLDTNCDSLALNPVQTDFEFAQKNSGHNLYSSVALAAGEV
jgi:hypothetical protein